MPSPTASSLPIPAQYRCAERPPELHGRSGSRVSDLAYQTFRTRCMEFAPHWRRSNSKVHYSFCSNLWHKLRIMPSASSTTPVSLLLVQFEVDHDLDLITYYAVG